MHSALMLIRKRRAIWLLAGAVVLITLVQTPGPLLAAPTVIEQAAFRAAGAQQWRVDVTLRHPDTGWEHYADLWVVEAPDGTELGRRVLVHPHETEQPFTRSTTLRIPAGLTKVVVRAGCTQDGLNSTPLLVDLTQSSGTGYSVSR